MWSCCRVEISGQEIIAADTQAYSSPSVASKVAERTPTTSGGDSFGDPSPLSVAEASKRQDFSLAKHESVNGSTITGGCSGSSIDSSLDLEAEQVPVLPEKAPVEEDQIILTSFKARMEKAKDSVEALRAKLQADIIKGRVAQNEAEARELGYYSTSTLMRYLCHTDGDVNKAFKEIKSTVEWRKHNLPPELFVQGSKLPCCRSCAKDPRSHCFLSLGKDVLGRHIIYSNTGRAANKTPEDGIEHMASEMERLFQNSSMPGQIVWVVDLSGFGISDCNPKTGALAFPMFANHYPERFGQIVLLSFPYAFYPLYLAGQRILDKVTLAKVKILKDDQDLDRYGNAYWSHDPALHQWLNAAIKGKCTPGHFPDPKDLRCTPETESAIRQIQRCAALVEGASKA